MFPFLRCLVAALLAVVSLIGSARAAEAPEAMDAARIRLALEKLNVLGRVLYVAAHPDDENTGLISYWANGALYDAAYLSLTRGDGGQNLIGSELREELGVIRTQELLAARRIDHGQQFFTRANDFGFSKSADESLRIWDRDKVLADMVWVMRKFQPDLVVTRFPTNDTETHGHHTASSILAGEAFRAAADPKRFSEQLKFLQPWQPTRLLWNSWEAFRAQTRNETPDFTGLISLEVGGYQPLLGKSYPEIASASRSMHKSQGFGVEIRRGERKEYFKFLDGKPITDGGIFDGIDTSWSRVPGAAGIGQKIEQILREFDDTRPGSSVPALLALRKELRALESASWVKEKLADLDEIIGACLGLHLEAVTEKPNAQPGENLALQIEAINRSPVDVTFKSLRLLANGRATLLDEKLPPNEPVTEKATVALPRDLPFSQPYWLREPGTIGTYAVSDQTLIGRPENPPPFPIEVTLQIGAEEIGYSLQPRFRKVDRVAGEVSQPLVIAPPAFVDLPRPVFVFGNPAPKRINLRVICVADKFSANLALALPAGWKVEPASIPVQLEGAESETSCTFQVTPPATASEGILRAVFMSAGESAPAYSREQITYPHIERQTLISPAQARIVRAKIENKAAKVGYIPGAGDATAESLREIGSEMKVLADDDVKAANLARFDAVVLGVRAYNVHPERISAWSRELLAYAKQGGVVVVQYNTTPGPKPNELPHSLQVSHDRVTDENAPIRILAPEHPIMNFPNKITSADFTGWVQERGLYFPDQWDSAWEPILSSNDPGEKPLDGGLLVTRLDQGWFIYTGYSWFRELPAGVPGAYRIFANMISLGKAGQ
ncbi:MAG TPA: PIG-L family deacetylase [Chthoniobacterales bacterium]|nr:PIG-L family deacetylase [Chthoniobacterales bacterium]